MADTSVFIDGVANDAIAGDIRANLPPWATEATLDKIRKLLASNNSGSGSTSKARQIRDEKDLDKIRKDAIYYGFKQGQIVKNLNNAMMIMADKTARFALAASMAAVAIDKVWDAVKENTTMFDALFKAGVNVTDASFGTSNAFESLKNMASYSSMNLKEFGDILMNHAGANAIGAVKFASTLPLVQKNLTKFGYDLQGVAEVTASYLDSMMGFTNIQEKSSESIAAGAIEYGKNITKLSMATGQSRKQLLQQTAALSASTDANIIAISSSAEAAQAASAFAASFRDQNIGRDFLKMMSSKIPALNNTFQNLVKGGLGSFGNQLTRFTKSLQGVSPERAALMTKNFINSISNFDQMIQTQQYLSEAGVEGAQANLELLVGLRQQANSIKNLNEKDIEQSEKSAAALNNLKQEWGRVTSFFSRTFYTMIPVLEAITFGLKWFNTGLDYLTQGFARIGKIMNFEFADATTDIHGFTDALKAGIGVIGSLMIALSVFALAMKSVSTGKGIYRGASGVAGRLLGRGALTTVAESAGGSSVGNLGKSLASLGKGLGSGIGSLIGKTLTGLADGLKALGSPRAILGTVTLGLLSGSIFIAGKSMQEFANVSWDSVGKGLLTLAGVGAIAGVLSLASPALLVGAAAITAISGAMWVLGKSVQSIGTGFNDIGVGIDILKHAVNGFNDIDKFKSIITTINSLDITKAAAFAILNPLSNTAPTGSSIKSPSAPQNKYQPEANSFPMAKTPQQAPGSGIEKPSGNTDINNLISYQSSLIAQLVVSMKELLTVNKDILKVARQTQ